MSLLPARIDYGIAASAAGWLTGDLSNTIDDIALAAIIFTVLDTSFDKRTIFAAVVGAFAGVAFRAVVNAA